MAIWSDEINEIKGLYESLSGRLPELESELQSVITSEDEKMVLIYSRRCLEVIITDLCERELDRPRKTDPLKGIIDKLKKENKIPSHIYTAMDHLNSLSTYGAHPKEFDARQVKPAVINLTTIVEWYITYTGIDRQITTGKKPPEDQVPSSTEARAGKAFIPKKLRKYIWPVLVAGNLLLVYLIVNAWNPLPFKERDWVVIADFDNQTGEDIFNSSLNTAFPLSISQSRHINVITRQRMKDAMMRMKLGDQDYIDEETSREIAMREGVNICIVPGISRIGTQYILSAKILDAHSAEILRSKVVYATGQDEIIKQMDQLTRKIRRDLGESSSDISQQDMPLSKVTTSSLDALKYYSFGIEHHVNMEFDEAVKHYENALRIDSNFTAAKASLGNLLYQRFDRERGLELLNQVIESIDDLTVREKYSILAFYAENVEGDLDKAIGYTRTLLDLYPDNPTAANNLGWYYQQQGNYDKAIQEYKTALRVDPYLMISYGGLIWVYLEYTGQLDSALIWTNKMLEIGPDNPWGYFYLGSALAGMDSLQQAETAYLHAWELNPDLVLNAYNLAHVYRLRQKYSSAIKVLEKIASMGIEEVIAHYHMGINYDMMGESDKAGYHFTVYRDEAESWIDEYPDEPLTYITYGLVLTRLGEKDSGWELGQKALEADSTIYFDLARLLAVQDRKEEALDHLEKALENGYRDLTWIKLNPDLYALHDDKRYQDLIDDYFH